MLAQHRPYVFSLRSHFRSGNTLATNPTPAPVSAADPNRLARHLRACQELIELGMDMARDAARDVKDARQARDEASRPKRDAEPDAKTPAHRITDPSARFERLARCVRHTILLEAHIAAQQNQADAKAARIAADREAIARLEKTRLAAPATPRAEQAERLPRESFPMPASDAEIPSILANISRELGIDLTDPTLSDRLPKPHADDSDGDDDDEDPEQPADPPDD